MTARKAKVKGTQVMKQVEAAVYFRFDHSI